MDGIPFPNINVMKDENELKQDKRIKFSATEKIFEITFDKVVLDDEGTYEVAVSNDAGKDSSSLVITTQGGLILLAL